MKKEVERIYELLQYDAFLEPFLEEVVSIKKEPFIIYDEEGSLINGNWYDQVYPRQKPGVRNFNAQNFAIYDTRYNLSASVEKKYSEFVHELFHCYQLRRKVCYTERMMIEGAALLVESIVYSRYVNQSLDQIMEHYSCQMRNTPLMDYYWGAMRIYKKMLAGQHWEDYFLMKM